MALTVLLTTAFWHRRRSEMNDAEVASDLKRLARHVDLARYVFLRKQASSPLHR